MGLASVELPRPKNWQDFERQLRELFVLELGDPNTQMHGRGGQPQCGVDIFGYREGSLDALVGVQCKLSSDRITEAELAEEIEKARLFKPRLSEFFLVTTAPRDARIQETARQINRDNASLAFRVFVWGWEDVCERAAAHAEAWKLFDPTWNPFAERAHTETTASLKELADQLRMDGVRSENDCVGQPIVDVVGLPDARTQVFVGREKELQWLTKSCESEISRIAVLVGEGGSGKSTVIAKWLDHRKSELTDKFSLVLGWSFYNQGTKQRIYSSDEFFRWLFERLGQTTELTNPITTGELAARGLFRAGGLLILDGLEVLQQGPGLQKGELSDLALRTFLRSVAFQPAVKKHVKIVITTRIAVADLTRWQGTTVAVRDMTELLPSEGAILLQNLGVIGLERELEETSIEYVGHPLALTLLATYLTELFGGHVKERDRVGGLFDDSEIPGQAHARRVLASIESEWLEPQPILLQVMYLFALFHAPADSGAVKALLKHPAIEGLTGAAPKINSKLWLHAIARLREAKLLLPQDSEIGTAIRMHPVVREWFDYRGRTKFSQSWQFAHSRLFDYFRRSVHESDQPSFEQILPLFQAVRHGCLGNRHYEALREVYWARIERRRPSGALLGYSWKKLGAVGSSLAALSCFFDTPYDEVNENIPNEHHPWLLNAAALFLRAQGRFSHSLSVQLAGLEGDERLGASLNAAISAANMGETLLCLGRLQESKEMAKRSVSHTRTPSPYIMRGDYSGYLHIHLSGLAEVHLAMGEIDEAKKIFDNIAAESKVNIGSIQGNRLCEFYMHIGQWDLARRWLQAVAAVTLRQKFLQDMALLWTKWSLVVMQEACIGQTDDAGKRLRRVPTLIDNAILNFRRDSFVERIPMGLFTRTAFNRLSGRWLSARADLLEIEEIAEQGPLKLVQCDIELERARIALSQLENYAPLGVRALERSSEAPAPDSAKSEAKKAVDKAIALVEACDYRKRSTEVEELVAVLNGSAAYSSLPFRV